MIQNQCKTSKGIITSGRFNEPYNRHSINIQYALTRADKKQQHDVRSSPASKYQCEGRVAQLEERGVCNAEAWGSNPHASTPQSLVTVTTDPNLDLSAPCYQLRLQCTRKRELPGKDRESLTL